MELTLKQAQKTGELKTQGEYIKTVVPITYSALDYAMDNDLVDYVVIGGRRIIVMTENTLAYTPNASKKRPKPTVMAA